MEFEFFPENQLLKGAAIGDGHPFLIPPMLPALPTPSWAEGPD